MMQRDSGTPPYLSHDYDNIQAEIAREDSFRKRKQVIHAFLFSIHMTRCPP